MIRIACALVCSIVLAGCGAEPGHGVGSLASDCPETTPLAEAPPPSLSRIDEPTIDDIYVDVARRVPAFGGAWVDEPERLLMINVTDGSSASARAAKEVLLELTDHDIAEYEAAPVRATYAFDRLKAWYDPAAFELLSLPGAVSSDIDDRANILRFGFEEPDAIRACAEAILTRLGVPQDAFVVELQDPIRAEPLRAG